jgi:4-methyl-5(b-hydroxyethyl)-thiazole monophosphate biosynthesis
MPRVLVPVMTDFEEIEFVTIVDILRRAEIEVVTAGLTPDPVVGARGIAVHADTSLDAVDATAFDAIVLPGGKGTGRLRDDPRVGTAVRALAEQGKLTAAICAAPTVLSDLGLLANRKATSHPTRRAEIRCSEYLEAAVVRDEPIYTSRGAGTAMAFALDLAARLAGDDKAREVAEAVLADWSP